MKRNQPGRKEERTSRHRSRVQRPGWTKREGQRVRSREQEVEGGRQCSQGGGKAPTLRHRRRLSVRVM